MTWTPVWRHTGAQRGTNVSFGIVLFSYLKRSRTSQCEVFYFEVLNWDDDLLFVKGVLSSVGLHKIPRLFYSCSTRQIMRQVYFESQYISCDSMRRNYYFIVLNHFSSDTEYNLQMEFETCELFISSLEKSVQCLSWIESHPANPHISSLNIDNL